MNFPQTLEIIRAQGKFSLKGVTKVGTDHTSKEPGTQGESLSLVSLEEVGQDGLISWSGFTLGEALVSRLLSQRLLGSG